MSWKTLLGLAGLAYLTVVVLALALGPRRGLDTDDLLRPRSTAPGADEVSLRSVGRPPARDWLFDLLRGTSLSGGTAQASSSELPGTEYGVSTNLRMHFERGDTTHHLVVMPVLIDDRPALVSRRFTQVGEEPVEEMMEWMERMWREGQEWRAR